MQQKTFTFKPLRLPSVERHCPKCGTATTFINTEKFRVNANKKNLDIWMILQCHRCRATFNLTLHERIHPSKLSKEALEAYMSNCSEKLAEVAYNPQIYQRSGTAPALRAEDWLCSPKAEGDGHRLDLSTEGSFTIAVAYPRLLRVDWALQQVTGLSRSQLKKIWLSGCIAIQDGRIKGPDAYLVHPITNFNFRACHDFGNRAPNPNDGECVVYDLE